jgi:hypothetical protein
MVGFVERTTIELHRFAQVRAEDADKTGQPFCAARTKPASRVATRMIVGYGFEYGDGITRRLMRPLLEPTEKLNSGSPYLKLHNRSITSSVSSARRPEAWASGSMPSPFGSVPCQPLPTPQHFAFGQLIEKVHALDQPHRMIERDGEHAEADIAVARNERRNIGCELHRIAVPRPPEVVIREPDMVPQLGEPDRLRNGHVDDAVVVARIVIAGDEHVIVIAENCIDHPVFALYRRTASQCCQPTARMPQETEMNGISGQPRPAMS